MSISEVVSIVEFACFVGVVVLFFVSHNKQLAGKVESGIQTAEKVTEDLQPLLQATPIGPILNIVDEIEKAAYTGVRAAQQLYNEDNSTDRLKTATEQVHNALQALKVPLNDATMALIDGVIKAAVFELKTSPPQTDSTATPAMVSTADPALK